jgi:putative ABC transport system ATP-binding protein
MNLVNLDTNKKWKSSKKINPIVNLEGVYKIFKQGQLEVIALKNIELQVYPGEIVVVIGPSGSGKTTLLNIIAGLEQPNAGTVEIKGLDITRLKDEGIQKLLQHEIGIIFQFFNLIPSLTAAGNVEFPMTLIKTKKEKRKARVKELLKEVGLENRAKHRPFTLSGGEKQRVAIAQAFANDPVLIVADEPTGNIDSVAAEKIIEIFHQTIIKNPDKAMVIVTHDPIFRKVADRTFVLRDGEIIREFGSLKPDIEENSSNEIQDEITKFIEEDSQISYARKMINEQKVFESIERFDKCPLCKSSNIFTAYDKKYAHIQVNGQQLTTRLAISCFSCKKITFRTARLFDIKKDVI